MNDVFAGFFALLVGLASSVVVFMLAKAKKKVADPADAKAPPRVFADHAREVLVEAFEEDVTAIQELTVSEELLNRQTFAPKCSAVAVPLSDYADLLQTERWAKTLQSQYRLDTMQLQLERDHYAKMYAEASLPIPWHQRPAAQRSAGGATVLLVVLATGAVYSAAYRMHQ